MNHHSTARSKEPIEHSQNQVKKKKEEKEATMNRRSGLEGLSIEIPVHTITCMDMVIHLSSQQKLKKKKISLFIVNVLIV